MHHTTFHSINLSNEYALALPELLFSQAQQASQQQGVSIEQFLLSAISEKLSLWRTRADSKAAPYSALDVACQLNLVGPPDWSENLDKYLYGEIGANEE